MTVAEDEGRRKIVVDLIPYLVTTYVRAQSRLGPAALLSRAIEGYGEEGREISGHRESLRAALRGVEDLNLRDEGDGFAFELDRRTLLDIVKVHLVKEYISEGSHGSSMTFDPPGEGPRFDAVLRLPMRSVLVSLLSGELTTDVESQYLESAVSLAPSQVWVLTLDDDNIDSRLNPVFRSENKVLFGRLRIVGLSRVLEAYLGGGYEVKVSIEGERFKVGLTGRRSA